MTIEIPMNQGKVAIVDKEDSYLLKWQWTYNPHGGGYASRTDRSGERQKTVLMHREIVGAKKGQQVDHINRNRLDNRRSNLRLCTPAENAKNASKRKDGITSKYKGVYFRKSNGKFSANLQVDGKRLFLGYYENEMDAAYYYNVYARIHFKEFAKLNKLPENYVPSVGFSPDNARGMYSSFRGVTYCKRDKRYMAKIQHKGKTIHIGNFLTSRMAAEFYNIYALELHGSKAIINTFEQNFGIVTEKGMNA